MKPGPAAIVVPVNVRAAWLTGLAAMLLFSVNFPAGRHGLLAGLSPQDLVAIRYAVAGLMFAPALARLGLGGIGVHRAIVLGLLGGVPYFLLIVAGLAFAPASHAAVLNPGGTTLFALLIGHAVVGTRPSRREFAALVVVLTGLVLVAAPFAAPVAPGTWIGDLLLLASGLAWAGFSVLLQVWRVGGLRGAAIVSVLSLAWLPAHGLLWGFGGLVAHPGEVALQMVLQGLCAGGVAVALYARTVSMLGAARAAFLPPVVPALATLWAMLFLGEAVSATQIAGMLLVITGMVAAAARRRAT